MPRQVGFWILFVIIDLGLVFGLYFASLIYGMQVNNQVLVEMARDIRPPPLEPSEVTTKLTSAIYFLKQCQQKSFSTSKCLCFAKNMMIQVRSPRGAKGRAGRSQKESTAAFGPNFEREVQRIIAEQEIVSKVNQRANSMSFFKDFNQVKNPRWLPTQRSLNPPRASSNSREEAQPSGKRNWSATSTSP